MASERRPASAEPKRPRLLRSLALLLVSSLVAIALGELGARVLRPDQRLVATALYLQTADPHVHRPSSVPGLHYELAPGTSLRGSVAFDEGDPRRAAYPAGLLDADGARDYTVSIGPLGSRNPSPPQGRTEGRLRVLFLGASTIYGAGVDDDETLPAYLQAWLRQQGHADAEVFNFGTSGYVLSQMAILGRRLLPVLEPDLVVVLHTNLGRRAFLQLDPPRTDYDDAFAADPRLWAENFWTAPFPVSPELLGGAMRRSFLVRSVAAAALRPLLVSRNAFPVGDAISEAELRSFLAACDDAGVPLRVVGAPGDPGHEDPTSVYEDFPPDRFFTLHEEGREEVFYDAHPPPDTLREWAETIGAELARQGLLPPPTADQDPLEEQPQGEQATEEQP